MSTILSRSSTAPVPDTAFWPDIPLLSGNFAPVRHERDASALPVKGELPSDLHGCLFRNGPNPVFPPLGNNHHWFLGEGMVHAICVENGQVSYRNRWVPTKQYQVQRREGRRLVGTAFGEPPVQGFKRLPNNVANTNIVWHGGKLLALDEGSPPFAMDHRTLEGQGSWDFAGKYGGPMTAHPKIDPKTGEMLFFAYQADGPCSPMVAFNVVAADGTLTRSDSFAAPYCSMMHDFAITDEHVIFPVFPASIDMDRIMNGGPVIAWDPSLSTRIGIMGRHDSVESLRWFEGDPCYVFHPMNACTMHENGKTLVVMDVMQYARVPLFPDADGKCSPADLSGETGRLVRWTFDMDGQTNTYRQEPLAECGGEFPRFDERLTGSFYTKGYHSTTRRKPEPGGPFDTLVYTDLRDGTQYFWEPGPGRFVHEPVFVPRHEKAAEGEGYLVSLVYDSARDLSDFVVLDAGDIAAGPLASVSLPQRVPFGFHGNWVPGAAM